jgi:hypothetical protein
VPGHVLPSGRMRGARRRARRHATAGGPMPRAGSLTSRTARGARPFRPSSAVASA